jgi:hypothetical protein
MIAVSCLDITQLGGTHVPNYVFFPFFFLFFLNLLSPVGNLD